MTIEEISGEGGVVDQFVAAAKQSFEAGFKGVELHGAYEYLRVWIKNQKLTHVP